MLGFIYWIKLISSHVVIFTVLKSKGRDVTVCMYCKQQNRLKQRICNKQKKNVHVKFQIYIKFLKLDFKKYFYSCFAPVNKYRIWLQDIKYT